ncbi:MAG: hypothetical protein HZA81_01700 [Candidatus Taylorbacteria bacterium]|nr:hypothetical protein [Candidatus Taylorbacteria bacterium]
MNRTIVAIGGLIVVVVVIFVAMGKNDASNEVSTTAGFRVGANAINVNTQAAGGKINVSFAVLEKGGFVAIHEAVAGEPGRIVAASALLKAGESSDISIQLAERSEVGERYIAMLHTDDGNGTFDETADTPVIENGGPIMIEFAIGETSEDGDPVTI